MDESPEQKLIQVGTQELLSAKRTSFARDQAAVLLRNGEPGAAYVAGAAARGVIF